MCVSDQGSLQVCCPSTDLTGEWNVRLTMSSWHDTSSIENGSNLKLIQIVCCHRSDYMHNKNNLFFKWTNDEWVAQCTYCSIVWEIDTWIMFNYGLWSTILASPLVESDHGTRTKHRVVKRWKVHCGVILVYPYHFGIAIFGCYFLYELCLNVC